MRQEPQDRVATVTEATPSEQPLQSWKEIGAYLERDERTARRWEKSAGLPVRRHHGGPRSTVYAYPSELDDWRRGGRANSDGVLPGWFRSQRIIAVPIGILAILSLVWFVKYGPVFNPPNPLVEAADGIRVTELWSGPDADAFGGPSPDGRYLSFVSWNTGDLALLEIETGEKFLLTDNLEGSKEFALNSIISPDNKLVAYSWFKQRSSNFLRIIGIDGLGARTVYGDQDYVIFPVAWSSDGEVIAARRYRRGILEIALLDVADGSSRVLKSAEQYWPFLAFSPDDRSLAFDYPVAEDSGAWDISLLAADGSGEFPLVKHPSNDRLLGWVPGREELLFLSDRAGTQDVWMIRVVDGKTQGPPQTVRHSTGQISPRGFTRDGSFFYSNQTRWMATQIVQFNETGELLKLMESKPLVGSNREPDWSSDGEYLAYASESNPTAGPGWYQRRLHVLNLATGVQKELVAQLEVRNPKWSPDGRSILVAGYDRKAGKGGLYEVDIESGEETLLRPASSENSIADWSSDGKSIFYVDEAGLATQDLESGEEKRLLRDPNAARILAVSPTGQRLIFATRESEASAARLMVMPASGGKPRELFRLDGSAGTDDTYAAWTADGRHVLFSTSDEGGWGLWRLSVDEGEVEKIWSDSHDRILGFSVDPGGGKIALSVLKQEFQIWSMENFLATGQ